jgi:hypothetical protein
LDGLISCALDDKTFHFYDFIAPKISSFNDIVEYFPTEIEQIYFYFSPESFTNDVIAEPCQLDGYCMVHGKWPEIESFIIPPLNRC